MVRPAAIAPWPNSRGRGFGHAHRYMAQPRSSGRGFGHAHRGWGTSVDSELVFGICVCEVSTMSSTVKSLKVTFNPINETNTFTNGDTVSGQVTLEVAKDCQISSLSVQFKGKARVLWSERHGNVTVTYHSKEKYFTFKHYFINDKTPEGKYIYVS